MLNMKQGWVRARGCGEGEFAKPLSLVLILFWVARLVSIDLGGAMRWGSRFPMFVPYGGGGGGKAIDGVLFLCLRGVRLTVYIHSTTPVLSLALFLCWRVFVLRLASSLRKQKQRKGAAVC